MTQNQGKARRVLLTVALVFLFLPNVHIIDILPDFIAYFILAKLLERASDVSPYFEEARVTLNKLGWVGVLKLPALVLVSGLGGMVGDTVALAALSFAICDVILSVNAIRYLFDAIFYLGERSSEGALLSSFPISRERSLSAEAYRSATYLFAVLKCAIASLPEFLLLTQDNSTGEHLIDYADFYPMTVMISQLLGIAVGIVWLVRSLRYLRHTVGSGAFGRAIDEMMSRSPSEQYTSRFRMRTISSAFYVMIASTFLTVLIRPDTTGGAPIIPTLLFPLLFTYGVYLLRRFMKGARPVVIVGLCASAVALVTTVMNRIFFDEYTLGNLLADESVRAEYLPIQILSLVECVLVCSLLVGFAIAVQSLIREHTGSTHITEEYRPSDLAFHRALNRRCAIFSSIGVALSIARCAEVFLYGIPKTVTTGLSSFVAPRIAWFGTLCGFLSVGFILFAFYLFSLLKDEIQMKYE